MVYKYLHYCLNEDVVVLFTAFKRLKLCKGYVRIDIRKKI